MERNTGFAKPIFILLFIFLMVLLAGILKVTASFAIPITMAVLLSFVVYPLLIKMQKIHIPWVLGIIIILAIGAIVFSVVGKLLVSSLSTIISSYPKYESRFTAIYTFFAEKFNLPYDEETSLIENLWNSIDLRSFIQNIAISAGSNVIGFVKFILTLILFMIFLLLEMRSFHKKSDIAFKNKETKIKMESMVGNIISEVTHYISIKFIISLITGILVALATSIINMDFPIIWGFLAFILNFIPNFGSIISWLVTTIFAVLQFFPQWGYIIYVAVIVLVINMVLGNFVEPRWEGEDLGLSPFIILVSLSLWGWIWGFVGMILSVPLMVIIKIIFENIDFMKPVAILIGNGKDNKPSAIKRKNRMEKRFNPQQKSDIQPTAEPSAENPIPAEPNTED